MGDIEEQAMGEMEDGYLGEITELEQKLAEALAAKEKAEAALRELRDEYEHIDEVREAVIYVIEKHGVKL